MASILVNNLWEAVQPPLTESEVFWVNVRQGACISYQPTVYKCMVTLA